MLPNIRSAKRHEALKKRSFTKAHKKINPRFYSQFKKKLHNSSVKNSRPNFLPTQETHGYIPRSYKSSNSNLARLAEYHGQSAANTRINTFPLRYNSFVSVKKIKLEVHHSKDESVMKSLERPEEANESKLILCDVQGSAIQGVSLKQFLRNQCEETEGLKNFFINALNDIRNERNSLVTTVMNRNQINAKKSYDLNNTVPEIRNKCTQAIEGKMKEVTANYRMEILKNVRKLLPESYSCHFSVLSSSLEVLRGRQRDVIIRKRKLSHIRNSISTKQEIAIPNQPVKIQEKISIPTSTEYKSNEIKNLPIPPRMKKPAIEAASVEEGDFSRISLRNYVSHRPPTSIKIIHKDYDHLSDHEINQAIALVNRFILLTFRNKDTAYDAESILKLAKTMKLALVRKNISPTAFKEREFAYSLREQLNKYMGAIINKCNEYVPQEQGGKGSQCKFFIAKGNNGLMVRDIVKQRWWWNYGKKADANLLWTEWCKNKTIGELPSFGCVGEKGNAKVTNHFERHYHLSNKKAMFVNVQRYYLLNEQDPFLTLPLTFHIRNGVEDAEFGRFTEHYNKLREDGEGKRSRRSKNIWIIKPGEYSNRGCGISVTQDYSEIKEFVAASSNKPRTCILQKYIERPLLINKRKFDIRVFGMLTSVNGTIKGYFYEDGYIRTSCKEYTLKNLSNKAVHLTNDAVQQKDEDYGKYETGNKISFAGFQKYLDLTYPSLNIDFYRDLLPQIKVCPPFT